MTYFVMVPVRAKIDVINPNLAGRLNTDIVRWSEYLLNDQIANDHV